MSAPQELSITVLSQSTGQSEVLPLASSTSVEEVLQFAQALLSEEGKAGGRLLLNGEELSTGETLQEAGVKTGDLLVLAGPQPPAPPAAPSPPTPNSTGSGAPAAAGGLDFSNLLGGSTAAAPVAATTRKAPVYFDSMDIQEAVQHNPQPENIVELLLTKEHLMKNLNYYNSDLARKLREAPNRAAAVEIWRQKTVADAIRGATAHTDKFHAEKKMQDRQRENPNDPEVVEYFRRQKNMAAIDRQYRERLQQYPESFSKILMLYISAKINGHKIEAFCDSGAQCTIMSKSLARDCGLLDMVDERRGGIAKGVGTSKILGEVHLVQLELLDRGSDRPYFFPCTIKVMDDPPPGASEMPFLLGLDMMKRHQVQIDLTAGVLRFGSVGAVIPFLHEHDLSVEQGGTSGFDADAENAKLLAEEMDES